MPSVPSTPSRTLSTPEIARPSSPPSATKATDGDPIDLFTGLYIRTNLDLLVPDTIPIKLERTYRNADRKSRSFGIGSSHPYDMFIVGDAVAFTYVELILADGSRIHYDRISPGKGYADGVFEHTSTPTEFYRSRINWNGSGWTVALQSGFSYKILGCSPGTTRPGQCGVIEHRDAHGNVLKIVREPSGNITRIISPGGKWLAFTYDKDDRVIRADAGTGKSVQYQYDEKGRLVTVVPSEGLKIRYQYDDQDGMTAIFERGLVVHNFYDHDLCIRQNVSIAGRLRAFKFNYVFDAQKNHIRTDVTEPDGTIRRVTFNESGYPTSDTRRVGRRDQASLTYKLNPRNNSIQSLTISCASNGANVEVSRPFAPPHAGEDEDDYEIFLTLCKVPGK